jgi:hypothetical protein
VAAFLVVAVVVVILVVAGIAFGSRRAGGTTETRPRAATTALTETAVTDTTITATAEAGPMEEATGMAAGRRQLIGDEAREVHEIPNSENPAGRER